MEHAAICLHNRHLSHEADTQVPEIGSLTTTICVCVCLLTILNSAFTINTTKYICYEMLILVSWLLYKIYMNLLKQFYKSVILKRMQTRKAMQKKAVTILIVPVAQKLKRDANDLVVVGSNPKPPAF